LIDGFFYGSYETKYSSVLYLTIVCWLQNLTDEAYQKRHQRPETDEKRRKRWDLQRQRELNLYESAREAASKSEPESPSPSDTIEGSLCNFFVTDVHLLFSKFPVLLIPTKLVLCTPSIALTWSCAMEFIIYGRQICV
jgi:hypothetical protein